MMTYTIYICPECGAQEAHYLDDPVHVRCSKPEKVPVEVIHRAVADRLAAALEEAQDDIREYGRAFVPGDDALANYREAVGK